MDVGQIKYSILLSANTGAGLHRMPVAMLGVRYKGKQKIQITREMLADVVRNFRKMDTGQVPVDYDHAIEFSVGRGQPVPASGWITALEDAPDAQGILWGQVLWTERARKAIAAKEYQYISPVIDPTIRDNRTGEPQGWTLTSAALTNQPVLQGMPALVLSAAGWIEVKENNGMTFESTGYLGQTWGPANTEIIGRIQQMLSANKLTGWHEAFDAVLRSDPTLAEKFRTELMQEYSRQIQQMIMDRGFNYDQAANTVFQSNSLLVREYQGLLPYVGSTPLSGQLGQAEMAFRRRMDLKFVPQQSVSMPAAGGTSTPASLEAADGSGDVGVLAAQINDKVKALMSQKGIEYASALIELSYRERALFRAYDSAQTRAVGGSQSFHSVDAEIVEFAKTKIAAGMDAASAYSLVLSEHPELKRRKCDAMRGR